MLNRICHLIQQFISIYQRNQIPLPQLNNLSENAVNYSSEVSTFLLDNPLFPFSHTNLKEHPESIMCVMLQGSRTQFYKRCGITVFMSKQKVVCLFPIKLSPM